MKYKILLILSTSATFLKAQDYDFKNYRYRVNGYKALNLNSNLRGNIYSYIGSSKNKSSSNNLGVDLNYNRFTNTEKHIKNIYYAIILNGNLANSHFEGNSASFNVSQAYGRSEDYFYKNNSFIVSRAAANGSFNISKANSTQPFEKQRNSYLSGQYEIGLGRGRLEYISDPVMANFILKDMKKKGIIDSYTPGQVEDFGKKISQVLSIRMIDYRFRLIDQITMLDSFLTREITDDKKNALFYTTLYDNWLYANRFQRFSGKRKEILIGDRSWGYDNKNKFNSDSSTRYNGFNNTLYIAYQYSSENPLRLSFQRSRLFRAELQKLNSISNSFRSGYPGYKFKSNHSQIALSYSEALGWFPNTRTYITSGARTNFEYQFKASEVFAGKFNTPYETRIRISLAPYVNLYYFISPKIKLNAYADLNFSYYHFIQTGYTGGFNINNNYSASLAYVFY